jgi:membrane-associated phospholipid phosphatase
MPDLMTPPPAGPPAGADDAPAGLGQGHGPDPDPLSSPGLLQRLARGDRAVSAVIAGRWPHPRWFTLPLGAISLTGNYGVVWVVLAAVGAEAGAGGFSGRRFVYVAGAVLATEWITFAVKLIFRRRRPTQRDPATKADIPLPLSPSFPSSHASMSTVGALTMSVLYPTLWPAFVALAVVLAASRVYLRVHYLADVLVGVCLGLVLGLPYIALVRL